jgi:dGTP triphosphohydrolase
VNPNALPSRLPAKGIALLFGVSEQRISQLKKKGLLKRGDDGKYSVADARSLRGFQMNEHGVRVTMQTYSNAHGEQSPAKITATTDLTDDEILGVTSVTEAVESGIIAPSPSSHFAANARLMELRERKLQADVERAELRTQQQAGSLIERTTVQDSFVTAGKLIGTILQNLPDEIAAVFADFNKKAEVRAKVQTRVDQMQHALYQALKGYEPDELS